METATADRWSHAQQIMEAAAGFLWGSELQTSLDAFTQNHAAMFDGAVLGEEQRLEWTEAHLDFQQVFELHLEQFIAEQEFSAEEFVSACQDTLDHQVR